MPPSLASDWSLLRHRGPLTTCIPTCCAEASRAQCSVREDGGSLDLICMQSPATRQGMVLP